MMELRDYLNAVVTTQSLEELWAAHCEQMAGYGFDRLIYGRTQYRTRTSLGDPEDFVILTNHSPEYIKTFLGERLYFHAPMTRWALENEGACSWRRVYEMFDGKTLTKEETRVLEYNLRMKVTAGYTISFKSPNLRQKGAIALTARADMNQVQVDEIWAEHGRDIHLMNDMAHLKILTLPYTPPNRGLTPRQLEALQWVGDGKTTQDIAVLMGLTTATVEKHLRLAREALAVETTAQAVLKATLNNQMFVLEG